MIDFAGNDYLGLARDPRLAEAAYRAALQFGVSATSSRWGLGWSEVHEQLEQECAEFLREEACCLLSSAFLGGLVYFLTLADAHDTVFCDEQSHTNLLLGMKAAGLGIHTYRHLDAKDLSLQLKGWTGKPPIIASDTVFGISGELAPLADLHKLATTHRAELLLDDAHGVFVLGETGRGAAEACGLAPGSATILGSMSKALGAGGGFLAGCLDLVERFRRSDPSTAATPLPIPVAGAGREALRIVRDEPALREQLVNNAERMRGILAHAGITIVCADTPILALALADADEAKRLSNQLHQHGLRVPYFAYPSERRDNLLRSAARSCYVADDLDRFARAIAVHARGH